MIKRALTGLATAVVAAATFGALTAPPAQAEVAGGPTGKPKTDCIWLWTTKGPTCQWQ
ncbi:hypothetical protein QRX60_22105 [Amycolatopsis mongoliensis]|uniref:Uncharacterized protein n=1 Tax=Amycolatopsis mongoliensis TaxID=715475 RepID=A0A9Y2NI17_9PSEU|nr:hypothetical protein [Amycolatopsis sp. 4-36]WIY06406.1 hypothetical protein QRX60_22105 [Amycolatopsis sp. 4-36]